MPETDFNTFYEVIREKESDKRNPFIRTRYKPKGGSTAYGPLQTTGQRVDTMLKTLKNVLSDEEKSALSLLRERQKLAAKYGGSDRAKYEDPDSAEFKTKEFLDRYDYGGDLGIDDPVTQSLIESAQVKELRRHFDKYKGDVISAAAAWRGGDNWRSSSDLGRKEKTRSYAEDAFSKFKERKMANRPGVPTSLDGSRFI